MNKQCVNCPGATDHSTAECPVMVEASAPIDPIHSAMMLGMTPEPCEPIIEITRQVVTKLLDVVEFGDQLERVEKDRLVAFVKELLAHDQPELWAMHSIGPNEVHPMVSKEEAERQADSLIALCKERFPDIPITVNVIPSPYSPLEHFEILSEELTEQVASLRKALDKKKSELGSLAQALEFYANGDHLLLADPDAWDTCSGEPVNFLHDEAGTASVEDGSIAKAALAAHRTGQAPGQQSMSELIRQHRIAITPEHEGQWHADLYADQAEPVVLAEGDTPEAAVAAVVASYRAMQEKQL